jgi:transposase
VEAPAGIQLVQLPAYSPELQPAEKLWPLSNEGIANRHFTNLTELEEVQAERCRVLLRQAKLISAATLFSWWPRLDC